MFMFVVVIVACVVVCFPGIFRGGVCFEGVRGAQSFLPSGRDRRQFTATAGCRRWETASCGGEITSTYGKRVCGRGQTHGSQGFGLSTVEGTLLLGDLRFPNIRQKARMRRPAPRVVQTGIRKAEFAIYCVPHFGGIGVLLSIVLPPANRA